MDTELAGLENSASLAAPARAYLLNGKNDDAVEVWNKVIAIQPDDAVRAKTLNGAAWTLLTGPPETIRNPAVALKLALRAAESSKSENPAILDTLALAHARNGDFAAAVDVQRKAIALLEKDAPDRAEYEERLTEFQAALDAATQPAAP